MLRPPKSWFADRKLFAKIYKSLNQYIRPSPQALNNRETPAFGKPSMIERRKCDRAIPPPTAPTLTVIVFLAIARHCVATCLPTATRTPRRAAAGVSGLGQGALTQAALGRPAERMKWFIRWPHPRSVSLPHSAILRATPSQGRR